MNAALDCQKKIAMEKAHVITLFFDDLIDEIYAFYIDMFPSAGISQNTRKRSGGHGERGDIVAGFVEVAATDANNMIGKLNDFEFQERTLKVREARDRQDDENQTAE